MIHAIKNLCQNTENSCDMHFLVRNINTGSPRIATVYFLTIYNNDSFETRRPIISKNNKISKVCDYKYQMDIKKQHSQQEIYYLSQSGMRLIKLLKYQLPCTVLEVQ